MISSNRFILAAGGQRQTWAQFRDEGGTRAAHHSQCYLTPVGRRRDCLLSAHGPHDQVSARGKVGAASSCPGDSEPGFFGCFTYGLPRQQLWAVKPLCWSACRGGLPGLWVPCVSQLPLQTLDSDRTSSPAGRLAPEGCVQGRPLMGTREPQVRVEEAGRLLEIGVAGLAWDRGTRTIEMGSVQQCGLGQGLRLELRLLPRVKLLPESQAAFCWSLL